MSPQRQPSKIVKFILANNSGVPMGNIADGIGISHSYLSELLNGKRDPSIEVCNKIADYFKVPRTQIYMLMGWIEAEKDEDQLRHLIELAKRDPDFRELAQLYTTIDTPEDRRRAIRVLKSLLDDQKP